SAARIVGCPVAAAARTDARVRVLSGHAAPRVLRERRMPLLLLHLPQGLSARTERLSHSVLRYSISALRSSSLRSVPYVCPAFELPRTVVSNLTAPGVSLAIA